MWEQSRVQQHTQTRNTHKLRKCYKPFPNLGKQFKDEKHCVCALSQLFK